LGESTESDVQAAELMRRYQQGERQAFDQLVRLLGPRIYRYFLHSFSSNTVADDLYQETWMKAHDSRMTHRVGEPVLPWLYGVAKHVGADHRRRFARHRRRVEAGREVNLVLGAAGGHGESATAARKTEAAQLLGLAMVGLPEKLKEALLLIKLEGLSVEEAASIAGATPGAMKVRAHRAYEFLRGKIRALEFEGEELLEGGPAERLSSGVKE